ncbi:MAG: response regulator [Candidatus Omnitrophota bacterium]
MAQKILVVDDEPEIVREVESELRENHYETVSACNGKIGLEMAEREHPDLILLDVKMPVMGGFETLWALKRTSGTSAIPVIMLSGIIGTSSILEAQSLGASDYIPKPFPLEDLVRFIKRHI